MSSFIDSLTWLIGLSQQDFVSSAIGVSERRGDGHVSREMFSRVDGVDIKVGRRGGMAGRVCGLADLTLLARVS